ncbi:O70 family O-antigen polymerase, partial [Escherichia coli]|nr:O70 family O-antigen polymerase [Escherichia coli]
MVYNILILIIFIIIVLISNKRLRIFSFKPTFLGAMFLLSLFIQIVPGTILVSFFDYPMSFGVDTTISNEVKIETFRYTFISISALLFIITAASVFLNFDVDLIKLETRYLRAKLLTFFSLVVIL